MEKHTFYIREKESQKAKGVRIEGETRDEAFLVLTKKVSKSSKFEFIPVMEMQNYPKVCEALGMNINYGQGERNLIKAKHKSVKPAPTKLDKSLFVGKRKEEFYEQNFDGNNSFNIKDLAKKSVKELNVIVKKLGIKNASKMTKDEKIVLIELAMQPTA